MAIDDIQSKSGSDQSLVSESERDGMTGVTSLSRWRPGGVQLASKWKESSPDIEPDADAFVMPALQGSKRE